MEYAELIAQVEIDGEKPSPRTIARFLRGDQDMKVNTIIRLAAGLGLRPRVIFEPLEEPIEESKALKNHPES